MKWIKWSLVLLMLIAAVVVFSTKIFQKKYTFYYYPEWNAYYDLRNKNYIYSINGGKTWDTITNPSNTIAQTLGERVVIRSNSADIWMDNAAHRSRYGGTLNDLVGNFLKNSEEKIAIRKKNTNKDSSQYNSSKTDSLISDSSFDNWVKETNIQENTSNQKKVEEENGSATNNEIQTPANNDSVTTETH